MSILSNIFGDANKKYVKNLGPIINEINLLEKDFEKLSQNELKEKTEELKSKLASGKTLDDILSSAFALVREASKRNLNQRHFDVQLIGGIVLHQGKVAEMKTGEGKTLASTLPAYLNALEGKGVHIITVNDYLAKRDTVWMGQIYGALGLKVGCITHEGGFLYDLDYQNQNDTSKSKNNEEDASQDKIRDLVGGFKVVESFLKPVSKKEAYLADITYGTNHEFGFDYLRDNMSYDISQVSQAKGHN
ncbi:MAG: preprotein translocase subunit SecA, partial [bacterium]|nr:preprotein translocase subunit SecA [bacterium]